MNHIIIMFLVTKFDYGHAVMLTIELAGNHSDYSTGEMK